MHTLKPVPDHVPATHSVHAEALAFDHLPPSQLWHTELLASDRLPASHAVHSAAEVPL